MVLDSPDYRLGYYDVLIGCSDGDNIYDVLDLKENNFSVANYHPVTNTLVSVCVCVCACACVRACMHAHVFVCMLAWAPSV